MLDCGEGDLVTTMGTRSFAREEPLSVLMTAYQDLLQGKLGVTIPMKVIRNKKNTGHDVELTLVVDCKFWISIVRKVKIRKNTFFEEGSYSHMFLRRVVILCTRSRGGCWLGMRH
jgi:hypothetical protein